MRSDSKAYPFFIFKPIPVDLMALIGFGDPAQTRPTRLFSIGTKHDPPPNGASGSKDDSQDSRSIYPFWIHYTGRAGGIYQFFTDSGVSRAEWKQKLEEAMEMRKVVQDSNKVRATRKAKPGLMLMFHGLGV